MSRRHGIGPHAAAALALTLLLIGGALVLEACGNAAEASSVGSSQAPSAGAAGASPTATPALVPYDFPATIAFSKNNDLYTISSDGTGLRRIARNAVGAAWSPDGSQIAYVGRKGLFVMDADGSRLRRLVEDGIWGGLAWSPDGRQIVFSFPGCYTATLDIVNADGSGRRHLTNFPLSNVRPHAFYATNPVWSPQGRIFFCRLETWWTSEVDSINPDGSGLELVSAASRLATFSLSPDGKWLLLWDSKSGGCVRMAASGRGVATTVLGTARGRRGAPEGFVVIPGSSWSPNAGRIVFSAYKGVWGGTTTALYTMTPSGTGLRKVPNTDNGTNPVWRPQWGEASDDRIAGGPRLPEVTTAADAVPTRRPDSASHDRVPASTPPVLDRGLCRAISFE